MGVALARHNWAPVVHHVSPFAPRLIPLARDCCILSQSRCPSHFRMLVFVLGPSVAPRLGGAKWTQPGRHPARPRASSSSLDLEGASGSTDRDGVTKRCPGLDRLARDTCARIAVKAPDSSPKSGDGTFRRRGWAHPSRQKFHRFRAAGRPCRMFVQEVLRRLRRPAPGIDEGTSGAWRCGGKGA